MTAPAGPCEWCGGSQQWTFIAGEMYVRCVGGCLGLPLEAEVLPTDSDVALEAEYCSSHVELNEERRVEPYEGGDARETDSRSGGTTEGCTSSISEGGS